MCEIAILDPDEYRAHELADIASGIYQHMRTGLGLVRVDIEPDGTYEYRVFKSLDPDFSKVVDFCDNSMGSYRLIIHGRLATSGRATAEATHPIHIECDQCDVEWVLHNGHVADHKRRKSPLKQQGHEFTTQVDTELIAHEYSEVPTLEHTEQFPREPAYILLGERRMFISTTTAYTLSRQVKMARASQHFAPDTPAADSKTGYSRIYASGEKVANLVHGDDATMEEADA